MKMRKTNRNQLLSLGIALIFALTMYPTKAPAQTTGDLVVNVPFEFHAGNGKLPPGKYVIHRIEDSDLTVMEISSADGSISALFDVQSSDAKSVPTKSEVIFNKYGNRYFLAELFDEGSQTSNKVVESRYERKIGQAADAQEHISTNPRG